MTDDVKPCLKLSRPNSDEGQHPGQSWAEAVEPYKSARAQVEAAEERALEAARVAFAVGYRALFEAHPDLQSFGWKQYVSFSDCGEFSIDIVYRDVPDINGID